ncbi:MAG TPA: ComEA family DNA-binding protein [Syntrophomonadaceae bacterium]|nr:ComEA family DNA-binding protein [Syntrophomonadaceae bacterium]
MLEIDRKVQIFIFLIAAALIFTGGYKYAMWIASASEEEVINGNSVENIDAGETKELGVHVAGAVKKPGVYYLFLGSRVEDALRLAEPLAEADLNTLNLARKLADGEKIYVPKEGEAPEQAMNGAVLTEQGSTGQKININTATAAELDTLPGIGPAIAQRIIDYRTEHGPFRTIADLQKVSGIGERRYEQLKDLVTI